MHGGCWWISINLPFRLTSKWFFHPILAADAQNSPRNSSIMQSWILSRNTATQFCAHFNVHHRFASRHHVLLLAIFQFPRWQGEKIKIENQRRTSAYSAGWLRLRSLTGNQSLLLTLTNEQTKEMSLFDFGEFHRHWFFIFINFRRLFSPSLTLHINLPTVNVEVFPANFN